MSWLHCKKMSDLEMELSLGKMALKALQQKIYKNSKKWNIQKVEIISCGSCILTHSGMASLTYHWPFVVND